MREQIQSRLTELKKEFEIGQTRLQELERQQAMLRETLLRISGAIQVLEEMIAAENLPAGEVSRSSRVERSFDDGQPVS
jgi:predicted nuclease with TOPRIM domain